MGKRTDPTYGTRRDRRDPPESLPRLFTDGGLLSQNPSPLGGSWAWCRVERGSVVAEGAGVIWAAEMPDRMVTSNQAEFYAVWQAFRALDDGEIIDVYLDSDVTLSRWYGDGRFGRKGIPAVWWDGMNAELRRHGGSNWHHLAGHPSTRPNGGDGKSDLERGYKLRKDGSPGEPVSEWNVYVDRLCTLHARLGNLVLECRSLGDDAAWRIVAEYVQHSSTEGSHHAS